MAALAAAWWFVFVRSPGPPDLGTIVVAHASTIAVAPLHVAQANGFFADEGVDVQLVPYSSGRDAWNAVLNGEADIATPYDGPVVVALSQEQPIRVLATLAVLENNTRLLGRKDRGIETLADLDGNTIGVIPGSSSEYLLTLLLAEAALTRAQVTVIELAPNDTSDALIDGVVDAVVTWRPHYPVAVDALGADAVTIMSSPSFTEHVFLASDAETVDDRGAAVEAVLRALYRAVGQIQSEPALSYDQAAEPLRGDFAEVVLLEGWANKTVSLSLTNAAVQSVHLQTHWFVQATGRGTSPDDEVVLSSFATEPLRAVEPTLVTFTPEAIATP